MQGTAGPPAVSKPLLPARPAICSSSLCSRAEWAISRRRERVEMTVVRAGMLIPAARVSVANTTLSKPCWKQRSTRAFQAGRQPAWWEARPASRGATSASFTASGCSALQMSLACCSFDGRCQRVMGQGHCLLLIWRFMSQLYEPE